MGLLDNILAFPQELRNDSANYPHITFTIQDNQRTDSSISLYMPPGLSIGDSMSYNTIDLGIIGQGAIQQGMDRSWYLEQYNKGMRQATKMMTNELKEAANDIGGSMDATLQAGSAIGMAALSQKLPGGITASAKDVISLGQRKVFNPNSNTQFQNANIRTFSFQFKLMAESRKDAQQIKTIVNKFRKFMYPERVKDQSILLSYPATFKLEFFDGSSYKPSKNLPKVLDSFLVSMETVYNASGNMFFDDGMPAEVDVTLNFQEVRAMTRNDVQETDNAIL